MKMRMLTFRSTTWMPVMMRVRNRKSRKMVHKLSPRMKRKMLGQGLHQGQGHLQVILLGLDHHLDQVHRQGQGQGQGLVLGQDQKMAKS